MGTNNKQRRRAKRAQRVRSARSRSATGEWSDGVGEAFFGSPGDRFGPSIEEQIADLIDSAAHAECEHRTDKEALIGRLVRAELPGGRDVVAQLLRYRLRITIDATMRDRWETSDLTEVVRRKASGGAARVVSGSRIVDPAAESWPTDVRAAIDALGVLDHLPPLPDLASLSLGSVPRRVVREHGVGPELLKKIRGLLAKAESTSFAEEADALSAKATELMTRYRIDRSALDLESELQGSEVAGRRIWIDEPYVVPKAMLLGVVARANGCESVRSDLGHSTVVGHPDDIEMTELLFTSLLVQATRQMTVIGEAARADERRVRDRVRTLAESFADGAAVDAAEARKVILEMTVSAAGERRRSAGFRRSFLVAFAGRIGTRLAAATAAATETATGELGDSFLPVLARQQEAVDKALAALFGELRYSSVNVTDGEGYAAGVAAADLADLGVREKLRSAG
jgi:hypothetical protein